MSETLRLQDDILQMMYWMRGEHLGDHVDRAQLNRFLTIEDAALEEALGKLKERNLIEASGEGKVGLTPLGIEEGKRRFLDEFSGYLGKDSHLTCSDPECDCGNAEWAGECRAGL